MENPLIFCNQKPLAVNCDRTIGIPSIDRRDKCVPFIETDFSRNPLETAIVKRTTIPIREKATTSMKVCFIFFLRYQATEEQHA